VWPLRIQLKIGSLKLNNKRFLLKRRADEDVNVLLSDGAIFFLRTVYERVKIYKHAAGERKNIYEKDMDKM
jgi:hypothetical protein